MAAPTRTERTATWFSDKWLFGALSPKVSEELHCDDSPDVWRFGRSRTGRFLDGVEHDGMPEMQG
jgi:hypothetical protein